MMERMTMRYTFQIPAGPGVVFTEDAARSMVGKAAPVNVRDHDGGPVTAELGQARVVAAEVLDGGAALAITVEPVRDLLDVSRPGGPPETMPGLLRHRDIWTTQDYTRML